MSVGELQKSHENGFTLVELLVTVGIAMFVLAGMSALFISQTRTAQVLNAKSEILNDLFLASQMMQQELRGAKAICWEDGEERIRYQPLSSPIAQNLLSDCDSNHTQNGLFQLKPIDLDINKPTPYICWDRQDDGTGCQELLRGMKADVGMTVSPTDNAAAGALQAVRTITLTAEYQDRDRNTKDLSLSFKVWPRNVQ